MHRTLTQFFSHLDSLKCESENVELISLLSSVSATISFVLLRIEHEVEHR